MFSSKMTAKRFGIIGLVVVFMPPVSTLGQVIGLSDWNIYLDPGHSQTENMGIYGYSEAEKNLGVALHLYDLLMTKTDIDTVYLSRDSQDDYIGLLDRSLDANSWGTAWFHSLHSNAPSTTSNSVLLLWGQYYDGTEKLPNGGHAMSDIMAPLLARGMRTSPYYSRGDCSFYSYTGACKPSWPGPYLSVNRNTTMPSELSEAGFHTNPVQNQRNMNARWKRLEAYTFFWSILQHHEITRPPVSILTGIIYDIESGMPVNGAAAAAGGLSDTTDTWESLFHKYTTDSDKLHNGFYFLEDVPEDMVELVISAPDYYPDTLQVAMVDTFFTFQDIWLISRVPPRVVSTTPAEGDTTFPAWDPIVITFSRPMDEASVETTFVAPGEVGGTFAWADGSRRMTFTPDTVLAYLTDYTLTISGRARDAYGHPFDGNGDGMGGDDYVLVFSTGPEDMAPPRLVDLYPLSGARERELMPIIAATFDEPVDTASVHDGIIEVMRMVDQYNVPGQVRHYEVGKQSVLCFFPSEQLTAKHGYYTRILPGLRDLLGNEETVINAYRFNTGDLVYDATNIDNFDGGVGNWWQPSGSGSTTGVTASREANQTVVNLLTGSTQSLKLSYTWDTGVASWLLREYLSGGAPRDVHFNSSYIMQAYVFGDGSGNQLRFCVDDNNLTGATADHEVSPWFTIDWLGWRLVSWDMTNDGTGTWLGDGNLDGTMRFDSFQLTYVPGAVAVDTIYFDDLRVVQARPLAVAEEHSRLPESFALYPNYPNPFNPATTIAYDVPRSTEVRLTIYNLLGQPVRTLVRGPVTAGHHQTVWDGKNSAGKPAASGIYIARLQVEGFAQSRKLVLTK